MPNITELDAGPLDIRPSDMGAESSARAAYRIGSYGNQQAADMQRVGQEIGQGVRQLGDVAMQYMEHREINTAAPHAATIVAAKNQSWNNFITGKDLDPNDPTTQDTINARINNPQIAQQWREENLDPDLDKFQQAFMTQGGQRWAQDWANAYRSRFTARAMADQSSMAGVAVQANIEKTGNTLATATFSDPSTLSENFDLLQHSIEGNVRSSPTMTPEDAAQVQTELQQHNEEKLVQAAVQGAISRGTDWRSIASNPKYAPYIKPGENEQFERQEQFYQRGTEVAQKQAVLLDNQISEQKAHAALSQSWSNNVTYDPATNRTVINPQFIKDATELPLRNPNAPNAVEMAKTYIDWAESQQKPAAVRDDPNAVGGLLKSFSDPNLTDNDAKIAIAKAEIAKSITPQTGAQMRSLVGSINDLKDPLLSQVMNSAKEKIDLKSNGVELYPGDFAGFYYKFIHDVYLPQKRAGTLPPNALDVNDPQSLISQSISAVINARGQTLAKQIAANGGVAPLPVYSAPAAKPAAPKPPEVGSIHGGYRFKGGDPRQKENWVRVPAVNEGNPVTLQPGQM